MAFGKGEEVQGFERKFYTGVDNFSVTAVSPSKAELEALWGREIQFTPEYVGKTTVNDADGEREVDQIRIDFFLDNGSEAAPIATKASFYVANTHHASSTGKVRAINIYGDDAWLTQDDIDNGTLPDNMKWYDNTGVKVAKKGEVELIDFLKNLLNVAFNNDKTLNKKEAEAEIEAHQWADIFKGDVSVIRDMVKTTNNKVGLACGVKRATDNTMSQAVFTKKALRQYQLHSTREDKFKWLLKEIKETQAGGGMSQIDFGPEDLFLRESTLTPTPLTAENMPDLSDGIVSEVSGDELDF